MLGTYIIIVLGALIGGAYGFRLGRSFEGVKQEAERSRRKVEAEIMLREYRERVAAERARATSYETKDGSNA